MKETEEQYKMVIFTAPSGSGKTTLVRHLLQVFDQLSFSISATSREKRSYEVEGSDYYFLGLERFLSKIKTEAFAEWEEVYNNQYYGTLKSEIKRIWDEEKHIIFDIDVQGAQRLKKTYGDKALTVFVMPPSKEILFQRLVDRNTESEESLKKRIDKADHELSFADQFDVILVNDDLKIAKQEAENIVKEYLAQ